MIVLSDALHILVLACLFVPVLLTLNVAWVWGRMPLLCPALLPGLGAYVTGVFLTLFDWPWYLTLAATLNLMLALAVWALRGLMDRPRLLGLLTLAVQGAVPLGLATLFPLSRGTLIMTESLTVFGLSLHRPVVFLVPAVLWAGLFTLVMCVLARSPWARLIRALRDDPESTVLNGKRIGEIQISIVMFLVIASAVSGGLFFLYRRVAAPTDYGALMALMMAAVLLTVRRGYALTAWGAAIVLASVQVVLPRFGLPAVWQQGGLVAVCLVALAVVRPWRKEAAR